MDQIDPLMLLSRPSNHILQSPAEPPFIKPSHLPLFCGLLLSLSKMMSSSVIIRGPTQISQPVDIS